MKKPKLSTIERIFVLIAALTLFVATFHVLSSDGVLPGNDPAVHLIKSSIIVEDQGVSYSEIAWYPPLFHTFLATLQIFAGTLDVMVAAFLLKMMVATLNVLLMLCTYLLARKLCGRIVAVASTVFTFASVPLFEIIFWGGYANFLGFCFIALIFYIMTKDFGLKIKTFLLFFGCFILGLTHQLSMFVFVFLFVPTFFVGTSGGSKKKLLVFLAMIIGGGLALLAWYARIIIEYADIMIQYIFFSTSENFYYIDSVQYVALDKNLALTLYLTIIGIVATFVLIKMKKIPKSALLIVFWLAVPFAFSQSYLLGVALPYHRFFYFIATPIAVLSAVTVYCIVQLPQVVKTKLIPKLQHKREILTASKLLVFALILILFSVQASVFLQRIEGYPQFYERATIPSLHSGLWVKQYSTVEDTMVVPRSPGSWFTVFSERMTMEETDPLYSRNVVAEAVLYSFYEMENSRTLTQLYKLENPNAGQQFYVSVYNIWTEVFTMPNGFVYVIYTNNAGEWVYIPLSETVETIYWTQTTSEISQLVNEYNHELFTVEKVVTFQNNSSKISIQWKLTVKTDLQDARLAIYNYLDPRLDFKECLVPGVLEWQNPWDRPSNVDEDGGWSLVETSADGIKGNVASFLDTENKILATIEFNRIPDWLSIGALDNYFIDALRFHYYFGNLTESEEAQASFSVLCYAFQNQEVERLQWSEIVEKYDSETVLPVKHRDYLTYIDEYNIKFVAVDTMRVPSNKPATPDLDKVYDNGRAEVYATKK